MRVLWIINILLPDIAHSMARNVPAIGGWMEAAAKMLRTDNSINLGIATTYKGNSLIHKRINNIDYFVIPTKTSNKKYDKSLEIHWSSLQKLFNPDIVHIHGSEYPRGLAYINANGNNNVVVSMQGIISVYERYYFGGLEFLEILLNTTIRDIIKWDTLFHQKLDFNRRGNLEKSLLKNSKFIIGRTDWDRIHSTNINPNAKYYFCNETLREVFYSSKWNYEDCEKYSIFVSQAGYPLKGVHQAIKALPLIKRRYPSTKLYIAGEDITKSSNYLSTIKRTGYGKYIYNLIRRLDLTDNVVFLGMLNEAQMCKQYLHSHIFLCPSAIENSPNSICEAQILGVPTIAANVGGVENLIQDKKSGYLYRYEEYECLAELCVQVFQSSNHSSSFSEYSIIEASRRHDRVLNAERLKIIYNEIISYNS